MSDGNGRGKISDAFVNSAGELVGIVSATAVLAVRGKVARKIPISVGKSSALSGFMLNAFLVDHRGDGSSE